MGSRARVHACGGLRACGGRDTHGSSRRVPGLRTRSVLDGDAAAGASAAAPVRQPLPTSSRRAGLAAPACENMASCSCTVTSGPFPTLHPQPPLCWPASRLCRAPQPCVTPGQRPRPGVRDRPSRVDRADVPFFGFLRAGGPSCAQAGDGGGRVTGIRPSCKPLGIGGPVTAGPSLEQAPGLSFEGPNDCPGLRGSAVYPRVR